MKICRAGCFRSASSCPVEDFDAAAADVEARGYRPVQKGDFGETRFNYYESDTDPGVIIEILYLDERRCM